MSQYDKEKITVKCTTCKGKGTVVLQTIIASQRIRAICKKCNGKGWR